MYPGLAGLHFATWLAGPHMKCSLGGSFDLRCESVTYNNIMNSCQSAQQLCLNLERLLKFHLLQNRCRIVQLSKKKYYNMFSSECYICVSYFIELEPVYCTSCWIFHQSCWFLSLILFLSSCDIIMFQKVYSIPRHLCCKKRRGQESASY